MSEYIVSNVFLYVMNYRFIDDSFSEIIKDKEWVLNNEIRLSY